MAKVPGAVRTAWLRHRSNTAIKGWAKLTPKLPEQPLRIAIVGNAGYLQELEQGQLIDSHDLVVRMNNFRTTGFEQQIGQKTDIFCCSFYGDIDLNNPELQSVSWLLSSRCNNLLKNKKKGLKLRFGEHLAKAGMALGSDAIYAPSQALFEKLIAEVGTYPTTGLTAIYWALKQLQGRCDSVYLTGFSFFQGQHHYFTPNHDRDPFREHRVEREIELLNRWLREAQKQGLDVSMDAHMASFLTAS